MNREILRRMQTSMTGVAMLIGSLCLTKPVTLLAQRSLTSDGPIFREALGTQAGLIGQTQRLNSKKPKGVF